MPLLWSITSTLGMQKEDRLQKRLILPGVTTLEKKSSKCAWHLALHSNAISDPSEVCLSLVKYIVQEETHWICSLCFSNIQRTLVKGSTLSFSLFTWRNAIMSQLYWILRITWFTVYAFSSDYIFSYPVLTTKPMGIPCQETNQKHNEHCIFHKGTTPCMPVLVISPKDQSHISYTEYTLHRYSL